VGHFLVKGTTASFSEEALFRAVSKLPQADDMGKKCRKKYENTQEIEA